MPDTSGTIRDTVRDTVREAQEAARMGHGQGLGAAFLQPGIGYLLDSYWVGTMLDGARVYPVAGYQLAMGAITAFAFLGWIGTILLRETHCRNASEM